MTDRKVPAKTKRLVPKDIKELTKKLDKMADNWKHVEVCELREKGSKLYVDLSGTANFWGNPDFYVPIKKGKEKEAKELLRRVTNKLKQGQKASNQEVRMFWEMIDRKKKDASFADAA